MSEPPRVEESRWDLFQAAAGDALEWRQDEQARRLLLAALREAEQFGPEDPRLLCTLQRLSDLAEGQNDPAMERWCRRLLQIQHATLGPDHPDAVDTLRRLARAVDAAGRAAEAEALYRRALTIVEQAFGSESPEVVEALVDLALHLQGQQPPAEDAALWQRAIAIVRQAEGPAAPQLVNLLSSLADCYQSQARYAEAAATLGEALTIAERPSSPMATRVDGLVERLGEVALVRGDATTAEALLRRALAGVEAAAEGDGRGRPNGRRSAHGRALDQQGLEEHALDLLVTIARLLGTLGRTQEALHMEARAAALRSRVERRGQLLAEVEAVATGRQAVDKAE